MDVINLKERGSKIPNLFQYEVVAKMNRHHFTLIRAENRTLDFHSHPDSDEVFFIVEGEMQLEFRDKTVTLHTGDMCVVPQGIEHRPICSTEVICLLIEKEETLTPDNTGGTYQKDPSV